MNLECISNTIIASAGNADIKPLSKLLSYSIFSYSPPPLAGPARRTAGAGSARAEGQAPGVDGCRLSGGQAGRGRSSHLTQCCDRGRRAGPL